MRRRLVLAAIVLGLTGCASIQAGDTRANERLLTAAGFQMKAADTPEKAAHLQQLKPGKIIRREQNGQASYVYADRTVCNCLYTGTEQQFQEYRRLARQQNVADEDTSIAEDSSDRWGIWGLVP